MEALLADLPQWMILLAVVIYGVVKLSFEAVGRANERALKTKSTPPSKRASSKSYQQLKALADATGDHAVERVLDAREERAQREETLSILKKQDELFAKLAESSDRQLAMIEGLAANVSQQTTMLDAQTSALQVIARNQVRVMESWASFEASIDGFSAIMKTATPPYGMRRPRHHLEAVEEPKEG